MANTRSKAPASKAKAAATSSPASKTQGKNSKSTDSPSAKGRGRPRKTIDPQAEASPVAKKGRGRPRKEESVKATQPEANKQEKTEQKTNQPSVEKIVNNEQISKAIGEIISNNIVIKAGGINNLNQDQLVDNVQDIIATFNQNDIRAIFVKTTLSPALPIFYADKIYDQEDILNEDQEKIEDEDLDDDAYKQGLLELADADTVAKLLGSELKKKKSSPKAKAAKKAKNFSFNESSQKQNTETDIRKKLQSAQKAMTESTRALNGIERGSISPVSKQHEPEGFEPTEPEPKQPKPKELELNFMEHKGLAIEETTESSSKRSAPLEIRHDQPDRKKLKLKEPEKIGKFMPSISLIDAIRNTKEEQEQVVKKELGLDGSDQPLDEKLKDLAIVELFEIKLRSPKLAEAERTHLSFKGRKNFKRFNKNQKSKSALSRSFLDLEPITLDNKITFKSEDQGDTDATTDLELNMTKDFDGLMDDVNGYQPQGPAFVEHDEKSDNEEGFSFGKGESLFVPADSQNSPAKPRHIPIRKVSHGGNDNDDDDDDDDDEPRFAFSR
ncbi:hypothetical protein QCA50_009242 [Cerrena zonata]|uniref:Uncharacterized protein n=1 Tax=Cerrena zonata TaxID=2478898 RepID=A0AAW0G775_9APHY